MAWVPFQKKTKRNKDENKRQTKRTRKRNGKMEKYKVLMKHYVTKALINIFELANR